MINEKKYEYKMIKKELLFFLIIGITTVVIDLFIYSCFLWAEIGTINFAKGMGFLFGTIFSYFSNKNIIKKSNEFIPVRIDVDKQKNIAEEYNGNARKYGGIGIPNILFLDKEKKIIRHIVGFHDVDQFNGDNGFCINEIIIIFFKLHYAFTPN